MPKLAVDLSEFEARRPKPRPVQCWFTTKLTDEQRAAVIEARDAGYSHDTIASVLSEDWGIKITSSPVSHHFAGDCGCPRD